MALILFVVIFVGLPSEKVLAELEFDDVWSGGFSLEEYKDDKTYVHGNPCEERELLKVYYRYINFYVGTSNHPSYQKEQVCGFSSNFGFMDRYGLNYSEDGRIAVSSGGFRRTRIHPGDLVIR